MRPVTFARRLWAAAFLSVTLASPAAFADPRKFETPLGVITLDLDSQWSTLRDVEEGIGFEVGGGRTMQFVLRSLTEEIPDGMDASEARGIVGSLRRKFAADGAKAGDVQTLVGTYVSGYYVKLSNPAREPAEGEHSHMLIGFVRTDARPILFVIGWEDDGHSHAARVLAAVRSMKVRPR
jgi:hypothetical protein